MKNMFGKMILGFVVFFCVLILSGCSTSDVTEAADDVLTDAGSIGDDSIGDSAVIRSLSASEVSEGDTVTVVLKKVLGDNEKVLLVEEKFPSGWTVVDAGGGVVNGNTIKWAELTGAKSGEYVYVLEANSDSGSWTGEYSINGESPEEIGGPSTLD